MKKNTTLVVLSVSTVISVVAAIVFLVLLLQSQQVIRRMQALQTEGIKNVATNEVVSQENAGGREEIIRLLNGRIQVQENRGVDGFLFSGGAGAVRPGDTGKTEDAGYYQSEQRGSGKWNSA